MKWESQERVTTTSSTERRRKLRGKRPPVRSGGEGSVLSSEARGSVNTTATATATVMAPFVFPQTHGISQSAAVCDYER